MSWISLIYQLLSNLITINPWLSSMLIGFMMSIGFVTSLAPLASGFLVVRVGSGFNPILLSILFGFGAMGGETITYLIGYSSRVLLERKIGGKKIGKSKKFKRFVQLIEKWTHMSGEALVFVFAASPLPDDLLLIYLGIKKFPFRRIIIPCWLGKIFLGLVYTGLIKVAVKIPLITESFLSFALIFGSIIFMTTAYLLSKFAKKSFK